MAIVHQYGTALPLVVAGTAAAQNADVQQRQQQRAADLAFTQLVQQAQAQANQQKANDIQNAIAQQTNADQFNVQTQMEQQRQQQEAAFRAQQAQAQQQQQSLVNQRAAEDQAMQVENYKARQAAISQLPPDQQTLVEATGHLPSTPAARPAKLADNVQYQAAQAQLKTLTDTEKSAQRDTASYVKAQVYLDPADPKYLELTGVQDKASVAVEQQRQVLQQVIDAVVSGQGAGIPGYAPTPKAPQSAPASQPRIVRTATNASTGQRIGLDANTGQWVAIGQ